MIKCLECNRELKQISYKHLKSCCGLTPSEYKLKHPKAELYSEETKKAVARSGADNGRWKGGKPLVYCELCGKKITGRGKSKLCVSCSKSGERNGFFNKKHSFETRLKMKEGAKHRDKTTYNYGHASPEKLREIAKERWANWSEEEREKYIQPFIEAGLKHNKKSKNTKIEQKIASILDEMGIEFKQNAFIKNKNVDFLIGNNIIECYGDYWHCNPLKYNETYYHKNLHLTAAEKWDIDKKRVEVFKEMGYNVLIFWEYDIHNKEKEIERVIKECIK